MIFHESAPYVRKLDEFRLKNPGIASFTKGRFLRQLCKQTSEDEFFCFVDAVSEVKGQYYWSEAARVFLREDIMLGWGDSDEATWERLDREVRLRKELERITGELAELESEQENSPQKVG